MSSVEHKLRIGLESGLPLVLVAPPPIAEKARAILPGNSIVELPTSATQRGPKQAKSIAAGVLSSTHAPGWLLWPAELGLLEPDTLVLGIEVNDPGVLIPQDLPFDLNPLAAMQSSTEPRYLAALPY